MLRMNLAQVALIYGSCSNRVGPLTRCSKLDPSQGQRLKPPQSLQLRGRVAVHHEPLAAEIDELFDRLLNGRRCAVEGAAAADVRLNLPGTHAAAGMLAPARILAFAVEELEVGSVSPAQAGRVAPGDLAKLSEHLALGRALIDTDLPVHKVGIRDRHRQDALLSIAADQQQRPRSRAHDAS